MNNNKYNVSSFSIISICLFHLLSTISPLAFFILSLLYIYNFLII